MRSLTAFLLLALAVAPRSRAATLAKALALAKQSLGEGWQEDASQVLDLAEFLLDCGVELPEAERLARGVLALDGDREIRARAARATARALRARGEEGEAAAILPAGGGHAR